MSKQSRTETASSTPFKEQLEIHRKFLAESLTESLARKQQLEKQRQLNLVEEKMMLKALELQEKDHKALLQDMQYKQKTLMEKVNRNIIEQKLAQKQAYDADRKNPWGSNVFFEKMWQDKGNPTLIIANRLKNQQLRKRSESSESSSSAESSHKKLGNEVSHKQPNGQESSVQQHTDQMQKPTLLHNVSSLPRLNVGLQLTKYKSSLPDIKGTGVSSLKSSILQQGQLEPMPASKLSSLAKIGLADRNPLMTRSLASVQVQDKQSTSSVGYVLSSADEFINRVRDADINKRIMAKQLETSIQMRKFNISPADRADSLPIMFN